MNNFILYLNAFVCLLCSIRLVNFNPVGYKFKRSYSIFAYILAIAFFSVSARIFMGTYKSVDIAEVAINCFVCLGLFLSKGNVAELIRFGNKKEWSEQK